MEPVQESQAPSGITIDLAKLHLNIAPTPACEGQPMNPFTWFLNINASLNRIEDSLTSLHTKVDSLMASYAEAKQAWVDYTKELQDQLTAATAALTDAQATAQTNADALAAFQADDAATDASQLAAQEQAFADDLSSTLEGLQTPPVEPAPLPEPGTPDAPVDPGWTGGTAPAGEEGGAPQVNPL